MEVCLDNSLINQRQRTQCFGKIQRNVFPTWPETKIMGTCSLSLSPEYRIPFGNSQASHHSQVGLNVSEAASVEHMQCREPAPCNVFLQLRKEKCLCLKLHSSKEWQLNTGAFRKSGWEFMFV